MYHSAYELVKEGDLEKVKNFVNGNELEGKEILKIEIEKVICNKFSKILAKNLKIIYLRSKCKCTYAGIFRLFWYL